ncbi:LAME_0C01794g1_1 [Lachancea meyersii CBS 8951]|uniref:LAME_0C01794g1_1 n=1 Tax=Lachancea meyersii CBS 8951 TaxID=1266667 RepID=A0A1G4IZ74_9SACH|nr:LAME_0C01794g1_1 [Lachancea meyersii CBS 8951]
MAPPLLYKSGSRALKEGLLRNLAITFGPTTNITIEEQEDGKIEPSTAPNLISRLSNRQNNYDVRVKAACELLGLISDFPAESVLNVWNGANDLVDRSVPRNIRRTALILLHACLGRLAPTMNENLVLAFYYSLIGSDFPKSDELESELDIFIDCLSSLTTEGSKFQLLLRPQANISGLDEFLEITLTHLANEHQDNVAATTKTLQFISNCVENGLSLSKASLDQIIAIAHNSPQEEVRRVSLKTLATATHNIPAPFPSILSEEVSLLIQLQNRGDHLGESLEPLLDLLFLGRDAPKLVETLFKWKVDDKSRIGYLVLLISILVEGKFVPSWQHRELPAEYVGNLLYKLLAEMNEQETSSENMQYFLVDSLTRLINSDTFLTYMLDFPSFWISSDLPASHGGALNLVRSILSTTNLSNPSKRRIQAFLGRLFKLLLAKKERQLGFQDIPRALSYLFGYCNLLDPTLIVQFLDLLNQNLEETVKWTPFFPQIITNFYEADKSSSIRCQVLVLVEKAAKKAFKQDDQIRTLTIQAIRRLLSSLETENDENVTVNLVDLYSSACKYLPVNIVENLNNELLNPAFTMTPGRRRSSIIRLSLGPPTGSKWSRKKQLLLAEASSTLFAWSMAYRPTDLFATFYRILIRTAEYAYQLEDVDLYLMSAKVLSKLHCRGANQVVMLEVNEVEGISTALNRNSRFGTACEDSKWSFPENIHFLKEAQQMCFAGDAALPLFEEKEASLNSSKIDIRLWISIAILTLEKPFDWEVYSYVLTYMCPQFASLTPLRSIDDMVLRYQEVICSHLKHGAYKKLKVPKCINTDDLHMAYIRSLSPMLGYHKYAPKGFADEIMGSLLYGMQATEKTLTLSLNLLTICSQEIPFSLKRFLAPILVQLQTRITSPFSTPAILEFLLALSDSPAIISHLTLEEFKRVFAIAFKLIQSSKDLKERAQTNNVEQHISYTEQDADFSPSTLSFTISPSIAHFFLTLSYTVISSWFLRMSFANRMELAPFVVKNLISITSETNRYDYDAHAYLDLVSRFATSRNDAALYSKTLDERPHGGDDNYSHGTWVLPKKIISIETHKLTGDSTVTIRSSSGAETFKLQERRPEMPATYDIFSINQEGPAESTNMEDKTSFYTAAYTLMRLGSFTQSPLKVPDGDSIARSIQLFDKIPFTDFHKIGLLYVGARQRGEAEILSNTSGSLQYNTFLSRLGQVIRLDASSNLYTGGLEPRTDGDYALVWGDEITQVIFHTITLMPNCPKDSQFSSKKRHVGNDFVSIFYDESGRPGFDFNLIKSQFNFINIVINPLGAGDSGLFKVRMYRKAGVPAFFSTSHFKIMTAGNLAKYVRQVSIIADTFASNWFATSAPELCTTWARREKHLKVINEKLSQQGEQKEMVRNSLDFTSYI